MADQKPNFSRGLPPKREYEPRPRGPVVRDAQYDGWCYACSEKIDAGDRITPSEEGGWVHEECGTTTSPTYREPEPDFHYDGDEPPF